MPLVSIYNEHIVYKHLKIEERGYSMKEFFTIDDLSVMTMLSTRTLRNYITKNFLSGKVTFSYSYNGKKKIVRILLTGTMMDIHTLMNNFINLAQ